MRNVFVEIVFERKTKNSLKEIVAVNYELFSEIYDFEPYSLEHYEHKLSDVECLIFAAEADGKIVGDAISFKRNNSLYIWILGVSKSFRGKGIASRLLEMTEQYAKENGFESVTTKVYRISNDMAALMKKRNYVIEKIEENSENHEYDVLHFILRL
ncbi:MAG: GNAT family N-acetyltransferase [Candidatus Nanoarchaeia archaeon]